MLRTACQSLTSWRRENRLSKLAEALSGRRPSIGPSSRRRGQGRGDRQEAEGKPPAPPVEGAHDENSRIMPVAGGGFDQCCNAQAVVATESLLVIAGEVVQARADA